MAKLINQIRRKLSLKIGLIFGLFMILIELWLFIGFYLFIFNTTVNNEVNSIRVRSDNYARVLAMAFNSDMVQHIIMMEENDAGKTVVVQNAQNKILASSQTLTAKMKKQIRLFEHTTSTNEKLHDHLYKDDYIVTASPILKDKKVLGRVYLFLDTMPIRNIIWQFTVIFILLVFITLFLTTVATFYLSKRITRPLIEIKRGAEKIASGHSNLVFERKSVDELGDLARSIEKLSEDLNRMKKQRNEFLASVAHELRTPMTFIKGYADIASREKTTSKARAEYLAIIREEIDRLTKLIENLMTLARLEENEFTIEKEEIKLSEVFETVASSMKIILDEKRITLECVGETQFFVQIDRQRIEQVLTNLLMNAYKYSPPDSKITLQVIKQTDQFKIVIADEGEGIAQAELKHIFEHFYRVDKSRTRNTGGFGLGLSIVEDIVRLHGGTISVESKERVGTAFIVTLPYK